MVGKKKKEKRAWNFCLGDLYLECCQTDSAEKVVGDDYNINFWDVFSAINDEILQTLASIAASHSFGFLLDILSSIYCLSYFCFMY